MTPRTLYKYVHQRPDMRHGTWSVQLTDRPQRRACDQFFAELYMSAAEHLAEQDLDIDNIDEDIAHDDASVFQCPASSNPAGPSLDMAWDPDTTMSTEVLMATSADISDWPVRYMQHGRLTHLWWQFLAWWTSLHDAAAQPQQDMPSYSTFWRAWTDKWSQVLHFRKSSSHSRCSQCFRYQEALHKGTGDAASKREVAENWRQHLREQYHDRLLYWHLRWFSRQYRRRDATQHSASLRPASQDRSVLTIIIDSMDKSKLVWPQYAWQKPKELDGLQRPRLVCTLAIAHGWTCEFFLSDDEVLSHGAGHFCEVLSQTLNRVAAMAAQEGKEMPRHLVIQSDNTTSQAKNSLVGQFLATLVAQGKFETCTLNFLEVGHTHEDVDLAFGILLARVLQRHRVQCPAELATLIQIEMATWARSRGEDCQCTVLTRIRDFGAWLEPQGVHIHNCWVSRGGISAPHSFAYKRRHGLTDAELVAVASTADAAGVPEDVFCTVKHRMHSLHPNGAPTLVLPRQCFLSVLTLAPVTWEAAAPFEGKRADKLEKLADSLEQMTEDWGPQFSYYRAASALRELVQGHQCPPLVPGWLGQPAVPHAPVERYTGNVYFGHLPNMSWRMLVDFRR